MRTINPVLILLGLLMVLASAEALADDEVNIRLYNDDADGIVLSLYDMNAQPPQAVILNQRIDGFAWIPISVTAGAVGRAHLKWSARTADPSFPRCGYREISGVANEALIAVSADANCR
ncbi:MAG TPA: hypothetical protein VNW26_06060 [Steroidobacteraceae bacterium]|nr:hypothetical protein [Steroidobacteraceae bacterium]